MTDEREPIIDHEVEREDGSVETVLTERGQRLLTVPKGTAARLDPRREAVEDIRHNAKMRLASAVLTMAYLPLYWYLSHGIAVLLAVGGGILLVESARRLRAVGWRDET